MTYVLIIITVFTSARGIASDTRTHEFRDRESCLAARHDLERRVLDMKGQIGRQIIAACYPQGSKDSAEGKEDQR